MKPQITPTLPRRARMKDIADALGLAVITVSKALRDHADISRSTRARVWEKAREMRYTPNIAARSLVTNRSYVIGVVAPDLMISYFAEVAQSIAGELRKAGYDLFLSNSEGDSATEKEEIERLLGRQVDGLIVATSFGPRDAAEFEGLTARGVPIVLIDRMVEGLNASYIGTRDKAGGAMAANHLVEMGVEARSAPARAADEHGRGARDGVCQGDSGGGAGGDDRHRGEQRGRRIPGHAAPAGEAAAAGRSIRL